MLGAEGGFIPGGYGLGGGPGGLMSAGAGAREKSGDAGGCGGIPGGVGGEGGEGGAAGGEGGEGGERGGGGGGGDGGGKGGEGGAAGGEGGGESHSSTRAGVHSPSTQTPAPSRVPHLRSPLQKSSQGVPSRRVPSA